MNNHFPAVVISLKIMTMKGLFITSGIFVGAVILSQIYTVVSTNRTERQPYEVIRKEKDFEIRHYPAATMAKITSSAKSYKELGNNGFRKLAGYIFGGNEGNQQIAMTSPVHMDIDDSSSTMSFVMPAAYNIANLPKPNNAEVIIETVPEEYIAAITFGGFASDADMKKYSDLLEKALKKADLKHDGNFRFLGYNPPFQLVDRTNEIIVRVEWVPLEQ